MLWWSKLMTDNYFDIAHIRDLVILFFYPESVTVLATTILPSNIDQINILKEAVFLYFLFWLDGFSSLIFCNFETRALCSSEMFNLNKVYWLFSFRKKEKERDNIFILWCCLFLAQCWNIWGLKYPIFTIYFHAKEILT